MNHNILHICSINTNGLQQSEKRQRLIEWSKQQQCNILNYHCGQTIFFVTIECNNTLYNYPLWILLIDNVYRFVFRIFTYNYINDNKKYKYNLPFL
jgi:hypothetical protein